MEKELIGLGAYFCLSAYGRIVKDSQLAPSLSDEVTLARIAAQAWQGFTYLEAQAHKRGEDIVELMEPANGLVDALEERLRPSDWWDRVAKSYVSIGTLAHTWCYLAQRAGAVNLDTGEVRGGWGHGEWAQQLISAGDESDPTLSARLSLWGRRVLGDVVSTSLAALDAYPELAACVEDRHAFVDDLTRDHAARMEAAGLAG
ncbi:MAG: ferritin-like fold-containing protein [Actinomycetaceae bacterium]|nr:ferritin-like fold-containing protein [Actinomycetaceae bacterium]